jgi:hypothetical protein
MYISQYIPGYFHKNRILQWDWRAGFPVPGVIVSRASPGTAFLNGVLVEYGSDTQRVGGTGLLIEPSSTNLLANPRFEGGTPGVIGSGGVPPSDSLFSANAALTREIVGFGTEDGIPYVDLRLAGTQTNTSAAVFSLGSGSSWACTTGQVFALSVCTRLVGGSLSGISTFRIRVQERNGGSNLSVYNKLNFVPTTDALRTQRRIESHTIADATTNNALLQVAITPQANTPIDVTFRVAIPQVEPGSVVTSPILPQPGVQQVSTRAAETVTLFVPGPNRTVRLLRQDLAGAAWSDANVVSNQFTLTPRSGQTAIRCARVWEVDALSPAQEAALGVPA